MLYFQVAPTIKASQMSSNNDTINRIVRIKELQEIVKRSRQTLDRWEKNGILPPQARVKGHCIGGWWESDIRDWIEKTREG